VRSRLPEEWRAPIAFAALWVVRLVVAVARPSWWNRLHGHVEALLALLVLLALLGWLLRRSFVAWWIFVVIYVASIPTVIQHVVDYGLGVAWTTSALLTVASFVLLVSAPMRRFVGFRGRHAPVPQRHGSRVAKHPVELRAMPAGSVIASLVAVIAGVLVVLTSGSPLGGILTVGGIVVLAYLRLS
jgi:hypothetical protein